MVEETIQTIRETERQAQEIVESARRESDRIMKEAEERSGMIRNEVVRSAQEEAKAIADKARLAGTETESSAKAGYEKEAAGLKAAAAGKEKEAVDMVISLLA